MEKSVDERDVQDLKIKENSMCQVQKTARMLCGNQIYYLVFF